MLLILAAFNLFLKAILQIAANWHKIVGAIFIGTFHSMKNKHNTIKLAS